MFFPRGRDFVITQNVFMKIYFTRLLYCLVLLFGVAISNQTVIAGDYNLGETSKAIGFKNTEQNTIPGVVSRVITVTLGILAFVFFGLTLYAGFRWMTAQGNEEAVTTAKSTLQAAVIGLALVAASYAVARFILNKLGAG